jgi:hypothetical protein
MKKFITLFFIISLRAFSQEIPATKSTDTTLYNSYKKIPVELKSSVCNLANGKNKQFYFTSNKDLPGFNGDQNCFALCNSFDLKKNNVIVLEYDYKTTKISTEVKSYEGKTIVLVKVVRPKGNLDVLIPKPYHKYIELPKEICKDKPQVIIFETYN